MATLTINIPDSVAARVFDSLAAKYKYTGTDANGAAQTKAQFAREQVKDWLIGEVREYEQNEAAVAARAGVVPVEL